LTASKSAPTNETTGPDLDTTRIQTALLACKGQAVKLVSDGENNAFVTGHLQIDSRHVVDRPGDDTLRFPQSALYQKTGNCGSIGISDSGACTDFIHPVGNESGHCRRRNSSTVRAASRSLAKDYSWCRRFYAFRASERLAALTVDGFRRRQMPGLVPDRVMKSVHAPESLMPIEPQLPVFLVKGGLREA